MKSNEKAFERFFDATTRRLILVLVLICYVMFDRNDLRTTFAAI